MLESGEVFVLGRDRQQGVLAAERWRSDGGPSVIEPLPNHIHRDRWDPTFGARQGSLAADGPERVYAVALSPIDAPSLRYLARFDGKSWHTENVEPLPGPVVSIAAGGGYVTVSSRGQLWRRAYGGDSWKHLAYTPEDGTRVTATQEGLLLHGGGFIELWVPPS